MDRQRHEYLKQMIQDAIWRTFLSTGNKEYLDIYDKWFEKFYELDLKNLE